MTSQPHKHGDLHARLEVGLFKNACSVFVSSSILPIFAANVFVHLIFMFMFKRVSFNVLIY